MASDTPGNGPLPKTVTQRRSRSRGNGEGSIYQRADGNWCAAIPLASGRRKVVYGHTRQQVAAKLVNLQSDRQRGLPLSTSDRLTVGAYLAHWLEESARPKLKATTYRSYEELIRLHIAPVLGRHKLAKLQPDQVQQFLNAKRASGLSARRVQFMHGVLRAALNRAVKWQLVSRNVATLVDLPSGPRREIQPLDAQAATALLIAARGNRHEHLFTFLLATGLRLGEALGLQWSDLDMEHGSLTVRHTLVRLPGTPWRLTEPKSTASKRTIPVIGPARVALQAQQARVANMRRDAPVWHVGNDFVFPTELGTPQSGRDVLGEFKRLLRQAGLPETFRVHDLRHSTATYLTAAGVPPTVIMSLLGHSTLAMTQRYSHVLTPMLADAATRLEGIFASIGK